MVLPKYILFEEQKTEASRNEAVCEDILYKDWVKSVRLRPRSSPIRTRPSLLSQVGLVIMEPGTQAGTLPHISMGGGILLHVELNPPEVVSAHLSSLSCTFLALVNKTGAVLALFPPPHLRDFIHCSHSLEQYFAHTSPV